MESILSSKLFATRRGTIMLGIGAAVLAAIALLVYLNQYRNSVNSGVQPLTVLVAKSLIQKGTPGDVVGSTKLFEVASIPRDQWYVAAYGAEIGPELFTRTVCGEPILFWRTETGQVTALAERCVHRRFPLSQAPTRLVGEYWPLVRP